MSDLKPLETNAEELVALSKKAGADACDVIIASGGTLSVSVRDGQVEDSKRSENNSIGLRVMVGKKVASVTANSRTDPQALAARAVAMAKVSPDDPYSGLADPKTLFDTIANSELFEKLDLYDQTELSATELESLALEAEDAGTSVEGITKSMGSGASWSRMGMVLATSHGFSGSYERSGFSIHASMVAGEGTGMERDYDFDSVVHYKDLNSASEVGKSAGQRTARRLGPRQVKSGPYPVIFDPRVSSGILGAFSGAINGAAISRKTSFLKDRLGEAVCNPEITILDDPHLPRRPGSRPFDGEGARNEAIELVSNGCLETWLLDTATAKELGFSSNARAGRSGTGTTPSTTNCFIKPGNVSPKDLIADITKGLYLTETIGHGINMVTGDYSKGASGYWIENGKLTYPVAEITIAGNLKDMFLSMVPADDLEFRYSTNAPTLRIEGMTIGGN